MSRLLDLFVVQVKGGLLVAQPLQVFVDVRPHLLVGNLLFVPIKSEIADCMSACIMLGHMLPSLATGCMTENLSAC